MLANNGELTTMQEVEFRAYMRGWFNGKHSVSPEEIYTEAHRHACEDVVDFNDRAFGEVMRLINTTVFELAERLQ